MPRRLDEIAAANLRGHALGDARHRRREHVVSDTMVLRMPAPSAPDRATASRFGNPRPLSIPGYWAPKPQNDRQAGRAANKDLSVWRNRSISRGDDARRHESEPREMADVAFGFSFAIGNVGETLATRDVLDPFARLGDGD
jgi:hypothetical protein